jgi:class 3 adenylate cyclase
VQLCASDWPWESLGACDVKGREAPVMAYRLSREDQQLDQGSSS